METQTAEQRALRLDVRFSPDWHNFFADCGDVFLSQQLSSEEWWRFSDEINTLLSEKPAFSIDRRSLETTLRCLPRPILPTFSANILPHLPCVFISETIPEVVGQFIYGEGIVREFGHMYAAVQLAQSICKRAKGSLFALAGHPGHLIVVGPHYGFLHYLAEVWRCREHVLVDELSVVWSMLQKTNLSGDYCDVLRKEAPVSYDRGAVEMMMKKFLSTIAVAEEHVGPGLFSFLDHPESQAWLDKPENEAVAHAIQEEEYAYDLRLGLVPRTSRSLSIATLLKSGPYASLSMVNFSNKAHRLAFDPDDDVSTHLAFLAACPTVGGGNPDV